MFNHEPKDYICPFCKLIDGDESKLNRQADIVFRDESILAAIAPKWWDKNPGHVLVMPIKHHENIYDIPDDTIARLYQVVKEISLAMRSAYDCEGTSSRQHNEPAGDQDIWHFHTHVYPRYSGDELYKDHENVRFSSALESKKYADRLKAALEAKDSSGGF